jgi:hypothetical protein
MRFLACLIVSIGLLASAAVRAEPGDGGFDIGPWHGSPANDGCRMEAFFGRQEAPVALTIGLDRARGWTLAIRSSQFVLRGRQIKGGIAFDDEHPTDIRGDVVSPTTVSFAFPDTQLLDRHAASRKLALVFSDVALPFVLPGFENATRALRDCAAANAAASAGPAASIVTPVAFVTAAASGPVAEDPRLFSEIVAPMIVGFVGSVLAVLLSAAILFQIVRARARTRYFRQWNAEYRATAAQPMAVELRAAA